MRTRITINISPGVPLSPQDIRDSPVFQDWADRLDPDWQGEVTINAADIWGEPEQVHALQMTVARQGNPWPVMTTLRSETVDVLTLVTDGDQEWVVFVEQDRDASGGRVISNVAGGREWPETAEAAARRELWEELGMNDTSARLEFDITPLVPGHVLASPGVTCERVYMMCAVIHVVSADREMLLNELRGKKTGVTAEGEDLTLHVLPANQARSFILGQPDPDGKTLLALALAGL